MLTHGFDALTADITTRHRRDTRRSKTQFHHDIKDIHFSFSRLSASVTAPDHIGRSGQGNAIIMIQISGSFSDERQNNRSTVQTEHFGLRYNWGTSVTQHRLVQIITGAPLRSGKQDLHNMLICNATTAG
jgi:hypothetical protein